MKKTTSILLTICLILITLLPITALAASGDTQVEKCIIQVTAKTTLYSSLGTGKKIVALAKGNILTATAENEDYFKASYGKKTGYIAKSKVKVIPNDTTISSFSAKATVKTTLYKNVYSSSAVITLPKNAKLTITAENGNYYKATYGKKVGYVLKSKVAEQTVTQPPVATPTPTPTPKPTTPPSNDMVIMGSDFNKEVLRGVNGEREFQGNAPMVLDSALCEKALTHAKEMMRQDKLFHDCFGSESVTDSTSSGFSIGVRSANHAGNIALDSNRSRLGVGSVKMGNKQYTCVFSPQD